MAFRSFLLLLVLGLGLAIAQEAQDAESVEQQSTEPEREVATTAAPKLTREHQKELKRQQMEEKQRAALKAEAAARSHGNEVLGNLRTLRDKLTTDAKDQSTLDGLIQTLEKEAEEAVESNRAKLKHSFAVAMHALRQNLQANATRSELKHLAKSCKEVSKDIEHLEKLKAKLMHKQCAQLLKQAMHKAKDMQKKVRHAARDWLVAAHDAEVAGRKAGDDESTYERRYEKAERFSEDLSESGERFAEESEQLAEELYERAASGVEARGDELMQAATKTLGDRLQKVQELLDAGTAMPGSEMAFLAQEDEFGSTSPYVVAACLAIGAAALSLVHISRPLAPRLERPALG